MDAISLYGVKSRGLLKTNTHWALYWNKRHYSHFATNCSSYKVKVVQWK